MSTLNPEFKAKWLAALRSGGYQQASGALRKESGFCCLGVACDLFAPEGWGDLACGSYDYHYKDDERTGLVPVRLRNELGVSEDAQSLLASMNDAGAPFSAIADYIEANL